MAGDATTVAELMVMAVTAMVMAVGRSDDGQLPRSWRGWRGWCPNVQLAGVGASRKKYIWRFLKAKPFVS